MPEPRSPNPTGAWPPTSTETARWSTCASPRTGASSDARLLPRDLLDASQDGTAVEEATRATAGRWGLRDLVLQPKVFAKGSGIREVGDGTILAGPRGISLQVKARGVTGDTPEKATRWTLKNAAQGLRQ